MSLSNLLIGSRLTLLLVNAFWPDSLNPTPPIKNMAHTAKKLPMSIHRTTKLFVHVTQVMPSHGENNVQMTKRNANKAG